METDLVDLNAFLVVAQAGNFRDRIASDSRKSCGLSESVRRLEADLGIKLLRLTTHGVVPTDAGQYLLERLTPALTQVQAAVAGVNAVLGAFDRPEGTLRLRVSTLVAQFVLPNILTAFMAVYPDIRLELVESGTSDPTLADAWDADISPVNHHPSQGKIAVPIGPRVARLALAGSPEYLERFGRAEHPSDLLGHNCLRCQQEAGKLPVWVFRNCCGESVLISPPFGPLITLSGVTVPLIMQSAAAGIGLVYLPENMLRHQLDIGALEPVLEAWWANYPQLCLCYSGQRSPSAPLRKFIDFIGALPNPDPSNS